MFRPLGVIIRSSLRTYYLHHFFLSYYFPSAFGIPYALQVELINVEHILLVWFICKILNVSVFVR